MAPTYGNQVTELVGILVRTPLEVQLRKAVKLRQAEVRVQLLDRLDQVVLVLRLLIIRLALFLGTPLFPVCYAGRQVDLADFELEQALVGLTWLDAQIVVEVLVVLPVAAYALLDLDCILDLRVD